MVGLGTSLLLSPWGWILFMQLSDRGTVLSVGSGLLRSGQSVSGIISGVMTGGGFRSLFFCLLSGIILFGVILGLMLLLVMLLNGFRK